jgi:hypothetical protein
MIKRFIVVLLALAGPFFAASSSHAQTAGEVVLRAAAAKAIGGKWTATSDPAASSGAALWLPDAGVAKLAAPSAAPANYFDLTFTAQAGVPYHLWIRGRAQADSYANDSAFVQFSGSTSSNGTPAFRIGSTSATVVSLEDCNGCGVAGWGWNDNGYAVPGQDIYFAATGTQTVRIQAREDGFIIDEVVLSPQKYLTAAPGTAKHDATILPPSDGSAQTSITLVRGPYLQRPTDRSIVVVWATRQAGSAEVRYQTPGGTLSAAATSHTVSNAQTSLGYDYVQYEAALTGLSAATAYAYQPFVNGLAAAPAATLHTAPAAGTGSISFVAFGDSGIGSAEQRQLGALMGRETGDLALHVGDIVYGTTATTGDAAYVGYQNWFFDIYSWLSSKSFTPTEGNHDSRPTNGDGIAYRDLFVLGDNGAIPERYYSYDYGPVHFIVLDTEYAFQDTTRRAEQLSWIEADLSTTRQPWKVAVFHRSPYSSGTEHGSDLTVRAAFGPLFERYGVSVALSGHDHGYERSVPIRQSTNTADHPVTYVVTGGGGAALYPMTTNTWTAFGASRYEYVRGHADTCTLTIDAIGLDGTRFDTNTLSRCTAPPPPAPEVVLYAGNATTRAGAWFVQTDATAAGGRYMAQLDAGAPKLGTAAAAPANYFELTFNAVAGVPYRLWLRGRAQADSWTNDSAFVQFSGSVNASGTAMWRIGTADATAVSLEDCSGCGEQGWGWQDNGYGAGVLGPVVYFATSGVQRVRVQTREDGYSIDQIVLSPARYLSASPGKLKNDTTILTQSGGQ